MATDTIIQAPPSFQQPFLEQLLQQSQSQFLAPRQQFFPGQTVADVSDFTRQGTQQLANSGQSPFTQNLQNIAEQQANFLQGTSTPSGNPLLQAGLQQTPGALNFLGAVQNRALNNDFDLGPQLGQLPSQQFSGQFNPQQVLNQSLQGGVPQGGGSQPQQGFAPPPQQGQPAPQQQGAANGPFGNLQPATPAPPPTENTGGKTGGLTAGPGIPLPPQQAQPQPAGIPQGGQGQQSGVTNPFLQQVIQQGFDLNNQNFLQNVIPQLSNASSIQGGFGGSREGVAQGIGLQGLADANARSAFGTLSDQFNTDRGRELQAAQIGGQLGIAGDQVSLAQQGLGLQQQTAEEQFLQNAIGQGLDASRTGLSTLESGFRTGVDATLGNQQLLPQTQGLPQQGIQNLLGAGDIDRTFAQQLINENVDRFNFNQQQNDIALDAFGRRVGGQLFGSETTQPGAESGGLAAGIGGAAVGAGLASSLGLIGGGAGTSAAAGALGAAAGPVGWAMVGLGALAGLL